MTPERWSEIERLYHAALGRSAAEREAFLTDACGGDQALRHEVDSLFDSESRARDFMETPAAPNVLASAVRRLEQPLVPGRFVGRTLGAYDVKALIAAGGMGEVYRALDTRLSRTVALKTLPEQLANDRDRRARFMREAQIVSSLNHPHICTLYDVGLQDDTYYLVMEYIEGETLQNRLARGALPLAQGLEYSIQIVDALDKAHRRGVIHRDLKPGNVMLTKSGAKLLDFGLAMRSAAPGGVPFGETLDGAAAGLTAEGTIMGTLQYMSPEQLEGRQTDARSDIFAFGVVAYEMITGRPAFSGTSHAQIVGAILKDEPPSLIDSVAELPPGLAQTLSRCLSKEPDDRWQSASDLLFGLRSVATPPAAVAAVPSAWRGLLGWRERAVWAAAVLACVLGMWFWARGGGATRGDSSQGPPPIRYALSTAAGTSLYSGHGVPFALSPDGRQLVYGAVTADGIEQLWLRSLYSQVEQPIPGTEGANTPFWSADSQWIGFFAANSLKKVRASTGLSQTVAANVQTRGGATWSASNVILFANGPGGLSRVSAQGGAVSPATTSSEGSHFWPQFLSDGDHFIYTTAASGGIALGSLSSQTSRVLMKFPVRISALAYVPGYVFFLQDAALFARPFDDRRLEFSGEAIRLVEGIPVTPPGRAPFSVSAAGVLAYWPYPLGTSAAMRWFDRNGTPSAAIDSPALYSGFGLSPDARHLAFSRTGRGGGADVWVRDLTDGRETRLTFDGAAFTPQWSPDGDRIVFSGPGEKPPVKVFIKTVANAGAATPAGSSRTPDFASSWSRDGRFIVSVRVDPATHNDLWVHRVQDNVAERLPFNTAFNESHGTVSPDGRWIAYDTDASGKSEVWVASFPSGEIRRQVSVGGGVSPEWGEGSSEIIYLADGRRLMAVRINPSELSQEVGTPRALFDIDNLAEVEQTPFPTATAYRTAANGQRFLVAVRTPDPAAPPVSIVVNWRALLNR